MSSLPQVMSTFQRIRSLPLWGLSVATGLLFLLAMNSNAQVTIKERIVLQPHVFQESLGDSPTEVVYVAMDSGTFAGTVILTHKYTPIVPGRLSITRRGVTFDYNTGDYVDYYHTWAGQEEWRCRDGYYVLYAGYYAQSLWGHPLRFFLPDVHAGDTLRFVYHGSIDIPATSLNSPPPGFDGNVFMYSPDSCYSYLEGELQELEMSAVGFSLVGSDFAGFRIISEEHTIAPGEETVVRAVAVDVDGGEVQIDSTSLLRYTATPDTIGSFIKANGDTANFVEARYADARVGRIRFMANKSTPDSVRPVVIEVVQVSDTTKRGRDTVWIRNPARVTFTRPDSIAVYPYYPAIRNDTVTVGPKKCFVDLELKVMLGDSLPARNYWVKVLRPTLVDSGGHSHDGNRPMGRYKYPRDSANTVDTILARTDSTGRVKFRYVASQFGGVERIRAHAVSDTTKLDTLNLRTRVPGLVDFSLIQSSFWENVGNTGTTDACDSGHFVPIRHYSNHWATEEMIDSLRSVLWDFYEWSGSQDGGGHYVVLKINDMSLINGGAFDIRGNWNQRSCHTFHRTGLSVDLNNTRLKINDTTWTLIGQRLERFMNIYNLFVKKEGPIHFELKR